MRISVLGTTRALRDDGTPVAVGGARVRALLTALALRPGRDIPVRVLVSRVWDQDPPADATAALQALVGRLRRAVGHAAVVSSEGGYRLHADDDDVDLHRFRRLADEGALALEQGEAAKAADLLDDALALWQGPALTDLPDGASEALRWEARRLNARRDRLTAALALGRAREILPELAALCEEFPLDEPFQALRIRALREAGRPAEALAAYDGFRRVLGDRLGTDPGRELRALHEQLLHADGDHADGDHADGDHAAADRLVSARPPATRTETTRAVADRTEAAPAGLPPGNLRARLTSFVGREADIDAIGVDLGGARLITLIGPGGAGKTRLSQEAAERAVDGQWPDGVWLAELAPVDDPETVPDAVLTALGARGTVLRGAGAEELRALDRQSGEALGLLAEHCGRRRMLLLLDNCEHVVEAAAALAEELLSRCPGLTVLATSREPLGVRGEVVRPVEPLPPDPAHRLFAERARAVRPDFDAGADPGSVAEICRRLDGLPLAIELAAARLRLLTPRQIADRLDDRFRLLTSGSRTLLPRQQTLRAVVDWSWDLLDASERAVLRRLSVFAGGCGLAAAESVCSSDTDTDTNTGTDTGTGTGTGTDRVEPRDVPALLGSLIDKSLVAATPSPDGEMRYRLLETVAEYTAERLDESGDRAGAERRHLIHHRELARTTDPELRGSGQGAALARLQLEYENIRTALRRAVAAHDEQEALCLVLSLAWFWHMRDMRADALHWSATVAAMGPDPFTPPVVPAPPLEQRCTDAPPPMSPELLLEARREVGLIGIINADRAEDEWEEPERRRLLHAIIDVYRAGLPQTCRFPGSLWFFAVMMTGDVERLMRVLDETVVACERFGYDWELAGTLHLRANARANFGTSAAEASGRDADRALEIYGRLGDAWGAAEALSARGEAREKSGDYAGAAEDFAAAVPHAEGLEAHSQVALLRSRFAMTLIETGRQEEGEQVLRGVLEGSPDASAETMIVTRLFLAQWLGRSGRSEEARHHLGVLREAFRTENLIIFEGFVIGAQAALDCRDGAYADALVAAQVALEQAMRPLSLMLAPEMVTVHLMTAAWALAGLAGPAGERADSGARDAARLLSAAVALRPAGHLVPPMEKELLAEVSNAVRAAFGADGAGHEAARAEGAGLTMEEALALARPGQGAA
ncbi:hypothetical protein QR77_09785 [Streptomyces sp. 150FB]|uniref:AfsR/SARP family transcriptional regulator n=1 Tax=Streptomyces sp. 150FB TaxID=1576605 RepID=UPI0005895B81|nr:BTAD domain-containing putative transcriptional regulator [Streptomyces sp. 150FB]KIF74199.1 hypothetical protein QR77_09785 [Streptomyces sp. 150FB]